MAYSQMHKLKSIYIILISLKYTYYYANCDFIMLFKDFC